MKCLSTIVAIGLLIAAVATPPAAGQSEDGWVTLLDESHRGDWDEVGKANWTLQDGALTADQLLAGKDPAYLVSRLAYRDFQIRAEFWADAEANSGVFIRCDQSNKIDSKICYEVNIYDKRPDPSYGTGAIVMSPRSIRCPRPPADGIPMRSPRRGPIWWSCSMARRPPTSRIRSISAARSRCNMVRAW